MGKQKKYLGRIPLPRKSGGPQGSKKGKKGYNRRKDKKEIENGKER